MVKVVIKNIKLYQENIEKALKNASDFSEFKSFCLESSDDE